MRFRPRHPIPWYLVLIVVCLLAAVVIGVMESIGVIDS